MKFHRLLTYLFAAVWLANGLGCKLLGLVPRHQLIVARILGPAHAGVLTKLIGVGEVLVAVWLLSGRRPRLAAWTQIGLVATMNTLEFWLAPDLLLFGRLNAVWAAGLCGLIFWNEFRLRSAPQSLASAEWPRSESPNENGA